MVYLNSRIKYEKIRKISIFKRESFDLIMTTNDIEKAEILLCFKNGEKALGVTDDIVLLNFIAQYVKFIQIDEEKIGTIPLSEIIKNQQENR